VMALSPLARRRGRVFVAAMDLFGLSPHRLACFAPEWNSFRQKVVATSIN
jgi:hypothetical protein